jgi:phenylpyruvate tautomerase PptA (4-oxalocrotonate tautomerase family)
MAMFAIRAAQCHADGLNKDNASFIHTFATEVDMPIVVIHSISPADPTVVPKMISEVRELGAQALRCSPDNIWVIFRPVDRNHYSQNDTNAGTQVAEAKTQTPIVSIKANTGRSSQEREAFVKVVASAIGSGLSLPSKNVWIHYQEMKPEDIWFDGHWSS